MSELQRFWIVKDRLIIIPGESWMLTDRESGSRVSLSRKELEDLKEVIQSALDGKCEEYT